MTPIYHIIPRDTWMLAHNDGVYYADSLKTEGFIHFSLAEQVVKVANDFYGGQTDLLLLVVDPERLEAELRYEPAAGMPGNSERFPHLYGALNLDAVQRAVPFPPDADGTWSALPVLSE
jgi:uncharacterized protein (DUF952 family)